MNLEKEDWEKVSEAFDKLDGVLEKLWIDPDYSQELDYRRKIRTIIEDTRVYVKRYFRHYP